MGSRGRLMIDLNEIPTEDDEETDQLFPVQPETGRADPTLQPSDAKNKKKLSHASSVSVFQPFVRPKFAQGCVGLSEQRMGGDRDHSILSRTINNDVSKMSSGVPVCADAESDEREEGEWSDAEGSSQLHEGCKTHEHDKALKDQEVSASKECFVPHVASGNAKVANDNPRVANDTLPGSSCCPLPGLDHGLDDQKTSSNVASVGNDDGQACINGQEDASMDPKQKEAKDMEAGHSLNNQIKRKMDQHKEAMLGKKRSRQIVLIDIAEAKQAVPNKSTTPRRPPPSNRTVKEVRVPPSPVEKNSNVLNKDQKQIEVSNNDSSASMEACQPKLEYNGDRDMSKPRRSIGDNDFSELPPISRQGSYKQLSELRQPRNSQLSNRKPALNGQNSMDTKLGNKKLPPAKKPTNGGFPYQDTSVERLIREVTNEKYWDRPENPELQSVPGRFESVEEYVSVFEPLLFEECRAQLCSSLEELSETNNNIMVRVRSVERRERGWYDVIVLPVSECRWNFKEGDVAVLSTPRPGTVRFKRNNSKDEEPEVSGHVTGTVRRYIPVDTRDPPGAILHFFVGDSYDPYSKVDDDHVIRKLQIRSTWYLIVLGSLATTQREYLALHAFSRLYPQMQNAILKPSPDYFPNYEQQTPAMPECFTPNFVDHLHRSFNGPQLGAIKWAAMHTAAGTSSSTTKRQDPWPFTLVQGPPGTGKTHTVWGMLNVIHLVQYQHYYTSLLKKLAPQSYKQANESSSDNMLTGSIDEVLYNMDQNLFRTLSKLCPKPRMLVCAPSNAATDELLTRVLDRGFIDGEMKVYRPDVARVGVDSQSRAAQAVSVERRTEQLLMKNREEVAKWMQELRGQEAFFSAQTADLKNKLNIVAADCRFQGSVGVDPDVLVARDQNRDALLQSLAAAVESRDKVLVEISRLLILESRFRGGSSFNMEEARANLEASFANEAEIVFTTVSSSGRKIFSRLSHGFDMVVIDEAAQASEVGVLPPLALGAARCVLVGDPQQLPATVISKAAGSLLYSRSLFERFQQAGCPTMLLSVQYRMHPQIREFPSRYFYQGRLTDSESVVNLPDELYYKDPLLRPYVFYDITYGRESHRGGSVSYQNVHEAQFCLQLYEHLQKTIKSLGIGRITVGIITPYKLQLKCIQQEFSALLKSGEGKDIYINTVDAFQGQERDIVIMSCVRASNHGVGFVSDIRRMNVALTRARRALWVMGNANSLNNSDDWAALITDAKERNCFMDMDSLPKEFSVARGIQGKGSSSSRNTRLSGPRHRLSDMDMDRSGPTAENGEHAGQSVISRSGSYRPFKPDLDSSLDDFDQVGDKSRDVWQYGVQRRHNSFGTVGKRDT